MAFILIQFALLILIALYTLLSKNKPNTIVVLLMMGAVLYGGDKLKREYNKTQLLPGNEVIYKGKGHKIVALQIDGRTGFKSVILDSVDFSKKSIPADSVKNMYIPGWKRIFKTSIN